MGALSEHNADLPDISGSLTPWGAVQNLAAPAVRYKNAAHNLDGCRFARAVRADVADDFAFPYREADIIQRFYEPMLPVEQRFGCLQSAGGALGNLEGFADAI
ncbi:hypothetical protein D3C73_1100110 [compost metagenome]